MKKNILREDAEMKEMGIKASRLAKLQPQNYLVKRVERIGTEQKRKLKYLPYQELFLEAIDEIKNLNWQDLIIKEGTTNYYHIQFPKSIDRKLRKALKVHNIDYRPDLLDRKFKIFLDTLDLNSANLYDIYLFTETNRNRTHFPDGLPEWLLGLNLGIKIYRALLYNLDFIQSSDTASYDVQKLYHSLVQWPDVNCVILKNNTLLIDSSVDRQKKANILGEFIFELFKQSKRRKLELGTDMIIDSGLSKELGTNKIKKFIEELRVLARKHSRREPFSPHTFGDFSIPEPSPQKRLTDYLKDKNKEKDTDDGECEPCGHCEGEGNFECVDCYGEGQFECGDCGGSGNDAEGNECKGCDGSGYIDCEECDGRGSVDCSRCDSSGCADN